MLTDFYSIWHTVYSSTEFICNMKDINLHITYVLAAAILHRTREFMPKIILAVNVTVARNKWPF